jgi:acyl-CoA synthetase (AMP-forming)/AMP-acid ligase II
MNEQASDIHGHLRKASSFTVGDLLHEQVRKSPNKIALVEDDKNLTYSELDARVNQLANSLLRLGIKRGERIAVLSENRTEYLELCLAAARIGAIVATLNCRLSSHEIRHCIDLVEPAAAFYSPQFAQALRSLEVPIELTVEFGDQYEAQIAGSSPEKPSAVVEPEDGLFIMYTSGTTGLPKGALISHRAELARFYLSITDHDMAAGDTFVAWMPMYHISSTEHAIYILGCGGKVIIVDGAEPARLVELARTEPQWWLPLLPGMIENVVAEAKQRNLKPARIKRIGALADLLSPDLIAEATRIFDAPYWNIYGATEMGFIPLSLGTIPIGARPENVFKQANSTSIVRLVDEHDNEVLDGHRGELVFAGPTLFSGYWNAPAANREALRNGWYHSGDVFQKNPDGSYDFVDRAKYLIKSGGENIYPAEVERVLLMDPRVDEVVVVRRKDEKWGEVPVAFVVVNDSNVGEDELIAHCRANLAAYKRPKQIKFVGSADSFPRSTSGKIQRHKVEEWL